MTMATGDHTVSLKAMPTKERNDLQSQTMASDSLNNEIRIVMLGKTGVGKSSLGNNLIQNSYFQSSSTGTSVTSICTCAQGKRNDGTNLCVVDTPGLFDTRKSNQETMTEIVRCIGLSSPGPHVFFFILRIGRFTKEDLETVDHLVAVFGETVVHHVVVIFTEKDSLDYQKITLSDYLKDVPRDLNQLILRCHSRCAAINNRANVPEAQADIDGIINLVHKTIQDNGGNYYTGEIYKAAEEALRKRMKFMEEEGREREKERRRQIAEREQKGMAETELVEYTNSDSRRAIRESVASSNEILITLIKTIGPILANAVAEIAVKRCTIS